MQRKIEKIHMDFEKFQNFIGNFFFSFSKILEKASKNATKILNFK